MATATVTCTCHPDGRASCPSTVTFVGTDRIDALTNARLAGWGVRADGGLARCPACRAAGVPFPRAAALAPAEAP